MDKFWVYMLKCKDGTIYTGMSTSIVKRYYSHMAKTSRCKYTKVKKRHPIKMIACFYVNTEIGDALRLERLIKNQTKEIKEEIIYNTSIIELKFNKKYDRDIEIYNENVNEIEKNIEEKIDNIISIKKDTKKYRLAKKMEKYIKRRSEYV